MTDLICPIESSSNNFSMPFILGKEKCANFNIDMLSWKTNAKYKDPEEKKDNKDNISKCIILCML